MTLAAGLVMAMVPAAFGQKWEVGAGGGASFYNKASVNGVEAGFKPGYGFSAYLGQLGNRIGGEIRYTLLSNEMELSGNGKNFTMGGRTQALHYDVNFYFNHRESTTRPYLLVGGGMKQYTGTGSPTAIQPHVSSVVLTNTSEWKPLLTAGGGVRFALSGKTQLRAEVRLYMTQAPTNVITPVVGSLSGWYMNFAPMVGVSYVW